MPPRLTAFYARLTREDAASASIENQAAGFEDLRRRHGWTAQHYVEQGRRASGEWTPARRPALYQLLEAVERGEVERVVVRHLDRLGRGPVLLQVLDTLADSAVELWDFTGPVDYRTAAGELGTGVQALVGRFEVRRTGERFRAARRGWWQRGIYVGVAPYGYTSQARIRAALIAAGTDPVEAQVQAQAQVPRSPGLVVDEAEAQVVREVFAAALEGQGFRAIAAHLTGQGSTKRGLPWHARSVLKLLTDPKVAGLVHFDEGAYQAGLRRSRRRRSKQALAPGAHPGIIDPADWHAVQALIAARVRPRAYNSRAVYPLSGVLHCAHGHPMVGGSGGVRGGDPVYCCRLQKARGRHAEAAGCDAPRIKAALAASLVVEALRSHLADPDQIQAAFDAALAAEARTAPRRRAQERSARAQVAELEAQRDGLLAAFRNPHLAAEDQLTALQEVRRLNDQIAAAQKLAAESRTPAPRPASRPPVEQAHGALAALLTAIPTDPLRLRELVALLHQRHGLQARAVDAGRVLVSLDAATLDPAVAHLAARVETTAGTTPVGREEWAAQEQGKHLCGCGCGRAVKVRSHMLTTGIPRFVQGHHRQAMTRHVDELNASGYLTVPQAAERIGVGREVMRKLVVSGAVQPGTWTWGGRSIRVIALADLEQVAESVLGRIDGRKRAQRDT